MHARGERPAPRPELFAVRFEAAMRLGRPDAAGELSAHHLERLARLGYDAWVVRLRELGAVASTLIG